MSEIRAAPEKLGFVPERRQCLDVGCTARVSRTLPQLVVLDSAGNIGRLLCEPSPIGGLPAFNYPASAWLPPCTCFALSCLIVTSKPPFSPAWAGSLAAGSRCPTSNCSAGHPVPGTSHRSCTFQTLYF